MRTHIDCCNGCVAPKRYPGCHGKCPEYLAQRGELDEANAIKNAEKKLDADIQKQKYDGVARALRGARKGSRSAGKDVF